MLRNNKLNLLISIVCAVVLWAFITTVVNPDTEATISGVQVELVNADSLNDRGFTVAAVAEGFKYTVDVTVTGSRSEVAKLRPEDFKATADMAGYRKGTHSVPVSIIMPNNIEFVQLRSDTISVEVVDYITVFKPVQLVFEEEFEYGMEPGFVTIIPEEMEVSGIAEAVDIVDFIQAFVPAGALTEEMNTFRMDVVAIDKEGGPVYNVGLSQPSVEISGVLCATKRVPLNVDTIGDPNESIQVTDMYIPSYVTVRGAAEDLDEITVLEGSPIDLSSITSTAEIPIGEILRLPENIELADASGNLAVKIEVQGISRQEFTFTADMIEVVNLAAGYTGHVNTGSVTVTVLAPKDVLSGIKQENIRLYVDIDYRRASSMLEIEVTAECEIEVKGIEVEPQKVRVTIIRE